MPRHARARVHPLTGRARARGMYSRTQVQQHELSQCTFKPTLDAHSKALADAVVDRIPHNPDGAIELSVRLANEARAADLGRHNSAAPSRHNDLAAVPLRTATAE